MTATKQERRQQAAPAQSVDVVEDFDYSNHSDSYNRAFKAWRKDEKNDYVFRCKQGTEVVYVEERATLLPIRRRKSAAPWCVLMW